MAETVFDGLGNALYGPNCMIRKTVVLLSTLAFVPSVAFWAWVAWYPRAWYERTGFSSLIRGVTSYRDTYLVDVGVVKNLRVCGGVESGSFVMVFETPVEDDANNKEWVLHAGRFLLATLVMEDPVHCGNTIMLHGWVAGPGTYQRVRHVHLPCWTTCLFLAAYPVFALVRGPLRRWRRRRKGLCIKCGYNLAGNMTGVCPECGTKTPVRE
ncbi:MAG: hypothetical protein PVI86_16630 [Phycisphaerae bacterium]